MRPRQFLGFAREDEVVPSAMGPPLLVALFSVVGLTAQNPHSGIGYRHLAIPLGFSLAGAAIAWVGSRFLVENPHRRSLLAVKIVVIALFFGYLASAADRMAEVVPLLSAGLVWIGLAAAGTSLAAWVVWTDRGP